MHTFDCYFDNYGQLYGELTRYSYLKIIGGNRIKGFEYEIETSEEYTKLRQNIDNILEETLKNIKKQWPTWSSSGPPTKMDQKNVEINM